MEKNNVDSLPLPLPDSFEWYDVNIDDQNELNQVYLLLCNHYVESSNFRFNYSEDFLRWILKSPDWKREYHLSIRSTKGNKPLVGFICCIPVNIFIESNLYKMGECNFLCVHKKVRNHRMAPVLIKEIIRRGTVNNIFQAIYTRETLTPDSFATTFYYHRFLNPKKLIEIKFVDLKKHDSYKND